LAQLCSNTSLGNTLAADCDTEPLIERCKQQAPEAWALLMEAASGMTQDEQAAAHGTYREKLLRARRQAMAELRRVVELPAGL
jgi:hypothetical protein